jgi:hypothetical protein
MESPMSLKIAVHTDKYAEVAWPNGVPLPATGDSVVLAYSGGTISFVVDQRSFELTSNAANADATARITIHGHHPTPGSV